MLWSGCFFFAKIRILTKVSHMCILFLKPNCFGGFHTDVMDESINAKIQLAAIKNRGACDFDFFLCRVTIIL